MRDSPSTSAGVAARDLAALARFVERSAPLLVLTGAGLSVASGIPGYRDREGRWMHPPPVHFRPFVESERERRRYWSRSLAGWPRFARARPNAGHRALARLERCARVHHVVTQNVDGLHQRAGSDRVVDLHGRLDWLRCLECGAGEARAHYQQRLEAANPGRVGRAAGAAPDGDAAPEDPDLERFTVPGCLRCAGPLKPAVVFFGESVPAARVARVMDLLSASGGLLVVGSSLMVFSGFRFVREAVRRGIPVAALNAGRTRADGVLALKLERPCERVLPALAGRLAAD